MRKGQSAVITKEFGADWGSCFCGSFPESRKAWGREILWMVLQLPLQGRIDLYIPAFIRTVVERAWCRRSCVGMVLARTSPEIEVPNPASLRSRAISSVSIEPTAISTQVNLINSSVFLSLKNGLHWKISRTLPRATSQMCETFLE